MRGRCLDENDWQLLALARLATSTSEDLAAEARRLRPDVEIVIRRPVGPAYRYE